jgi:hypothetical protein
VILIHGFNVKEEESLPTLGRFRDALGHYAPSLKKDIFTCTWPGNRNMPIATHFAYSTMIKKAAGSALTLGETIEKRYERDTAPAELVIVAHSLGCKVAIEVLTRMAEEGRPKKIKKLIVALMAAAVPVEHLRPGGKYHAALKVVDTIVALHSPDDDILKPLIFGVGQLFAGDGRSEAVGLHAHPKAPNGLQRTTCANTTTATTGVTYLSDLRSAGPTLAARKLLDRRSLPIMPLLPG